VTISPLAYVPGFRIKRYLGQINLHFIRESWSVKGEGGIGAFYHETLMHAQAMCRAHIVAQGGNALTSFRLKVCFDKMMGTERKHATQHPTHTHNAPKYIQYTRTTFTVCTFEGSQRSSQISGVQKLCYMNHLLGESDGKAARPSPHPTREHLLPPIFAFYCFSTKPST